MTTIADHPALIVFGRDSAGKPHASWFDRASAELATKAAGLMNMEAVPVEGEQLTEFAATLPRGRVFSSGKAFTPFVAAKIYGRLVELTRDVLKRTANDNQGDVAQPNAVAAGEMGDAGTSDKPDSAQAPAIIVPQRQEDLGVGSQVLAQESHDDGWWEAVVLGVNGAMLTLRWRDFTMSTFTRPRAAIAFLPLPTQA